METGLWADLPKLSYPVFKDGKISNW